MSGRRLFQTEGPFRTDQLHSGDPYELSDGHPIECLQDKIRTLLAAGTRYVWVVRLTGMRRIEVYEPHAPHYLAYPGQYLEAVGVLENPVLVEALYDQDAAHETALRNLLQRRGYASLDDVRKEGRHEGELALAMRLLERAVGQVSDNDRQRIRQLDRENPTALAEAISGFRAAEDLTAWLDKSAATSA